MYALHRNMSTSENRGGGVDILKAGMRKIVDQWNGRVQRMQSVLVRLLLCLKY